MKKIILVAMFLIAGIGFSKAQNYAVQTDTFPSNFGKGKTFLYVVTVPGYFQVNKALKKIMEKEYTGDYDLVDMGDLASLPKKPNATIYFFEMIYDNKPGYFSPGGRVGPETDYSCGVSDSSGKLYRLPYTGGNYNKVITKYIKRLEEIRKLNEGSK